MVIELQPLQGCRPTKKTALSQTHMTQQTDLVRVQIGTTFKAFQIAGNSSYSFHTFLFQCVIHHPRTPTCGHFIALSQYWEMVESCLESTSGFINITIV